MMETNEKKCVKCNRIYPATAEYFFRHKRSKDGLNSYCKSCNLKACKRYGQTEAGKVVRKEYSRSEKGKQTQKRYAATTSGHKVRRDNSYRSKYNITLEEYDRLFQQQRGTCAICRKKETAKNEYGVRRLAVDHCHATGKIRGLLCDNCNRGIGHFKDDPLRLIKAAEYLGR